jgi:tetratricopeptide (TPR) repeat protein
MTLPPTSPAERWRHSRLRRWLALGVVILLLGAAAIGWLRLESLRADGRRARGAAVELEGVLDDLLAALPVLELDQVEPEELRAAARSAESRVAAGEFAAAPTEELALAIRTGAALRAGGDLDAGAERIASAIDSAQDTRFGVLDFLLARTPPDPDALPRAQAEMARVHVARDDIRGAIVLAYMALEATLGRDVGEQRTTARADRNLLVAEILRARGDEAGAAEHARHAVEEAPPDDPSHAQVRWNALRLLAIQAEESGARGDAILLQRTALDCAQMHFPDDDPRTAASRYSLAFLLHDEGPHFVDEALREYRLALDVRLARSRGDRQDVAQHMANYALLLKQSGRLREAEPLMNRALEMRLRMQPGDNRDTATMMNNVGTLRTALADYAGAKEMLTGSLAMRLRLFPDGHDEVAQSLQNLAWMHQKVSDLDLAIEYGREAVAIWRKLSTQPDLDLAIAIDNLAGALTDAKRFDEAESLTREALAIEDQVLTGDHTSRAQTLDNLAVILHGRKQHDEALQHAAAALVMRRALCGPRHPDVAASERHLGWIEEALGGTEHAVEHYRAALTALDAEVSDPGLAAEVGNDLADCFRSSGDHARAFDQYVTTLHAALASPRLCAWPIADAVDGIVSCGRKLDRFAQVEIELVRAAEVVLTTEGIRIAACGRTVQTLIAFYEKREGTPDEVARARREAQRWNEALRVAEGF